MAKSTAKFVGEVKRNSHTLLEKVNSVEAAVKLVILQSQHQGGAKAGAITA